MLSEEHITFLSEFMNPVYLQDRTIRALASRFVEESSLELHSFLAEPLAARLASGLRDADVESGLDQGQRQGQIPPHTAGIGDNWDVKGPPHKWRYCTLKPKVAGSPSAVAEPRAANTSTTEIVRSLQDELFKSDAMRAWLTVVSQMVPMSHAVQARRFRPGLDYTLATSNEKEARLDVVLGLTPEAQPPKGKSKKKGKNKQLEPDGWETGQWGGWEVMFLALV
jgi:prolyl 3-hydroxylase /prolyl 3,4-dihydroxylase